MHNSPSASNLWATTSKEWVIPAKPKPGRKPKKDSQLISDGDVEGKARRVQNRTAQRAFRERKQHQLSDLKERLQLYEQGEIERNVALQAVSKRLKEENLALKKENVMLRAQVRALQDGGPVPSASVSADPGQKKREASDSSVSIDDCHRKRLKGSIDEASGDLACHLSKSLRPIAALSITGVSSPPTHLIENGQNRSDVLPKICNVTTSFMGCGLCSSPADCLCRKVLGAQAHVAATTLQDSSPHYREVARQLQRAPKESSILDNLPAFQPAVALKPRISKGTIQPVFRVQATSNNEAVCSGDPRNCAACADDPFGQAFCAAFDVATGSMGNCDTCPSSCSTYAPTQITDNGATQAASPHISEQHEGVMSREKAWKVLKSHPNVPFADLRLLAEVVAKNSSCPGPQLQESNDLAAHTGSGANSLFHTYGSAQAAQNPTGEFSDQVQPALVPQNILIECGKKRMINVREAGVREALRLLDARLI